MADTVTVAVAVFVPFVVSLAVTVIVAVPTDTGVTVALKPAEPLTVATVATAVLPLDQVTAWFVALGGVMVAVKVPGAPPTIRESVAGLTVMPVTWTAAATVTVQLAVFVPLVVSLAVTVMVAVPAETGVTVAFRPLPPPALTVATAVLLLVQLTALFVALDGAMVAARLPVANPAVKDSVVGLTETPVTGTGATTMTMQLAVFVPLVVSAAVAVMTAVPAWTGVAVALRPLPPPLPSTVTTPVSLLVHKTALLVALAGYMVATRAPVAPPATSESVGGDRAMVVTWIPAATVTVQLADFVPLVVSSDVTVIVAVPAETGVTVAVRSDPLRVATAVLLLDQ
jgi:hypothetical protein